MQTIEELSKKKVSELKEMAKELDIKGASKMRKQELINAIAGEQNKPKTLSEVFDFSKICKLRGKSGLWLPQKEIKAGRGRFVMRFFSIYDDKVGHTVFKYQDVFCIGHHISLVQLFDATFMLNQDIEINLIEAGYSQGLVKKYAKIYEELTVYLAELLAVS